MANKKWMKITDPRGVNGHGFGSVRQFPLHASLALQAAGRAVPCADPGLPPDVSAPTPAVESDPEPLDERASVSTDSPTGDDAEDASGEELGAALNVSVAQEALEDGRKPALTRALKVLGIDDAALTNNDKRAAALREWLQENG